MNHNYFHDLYQYAIDHHKGSIAARVITHYKIRNYSNMIISHNNVGYDCKSTEYYKLYSSFSEIRNNLYLRLYTQIIVP